MDENAKTILRDSHPGFTIKCDHCGSENVGVNSDIGHSALSGSWGGVYLRCADCNEVGYVFEY